MLLDKFGLKELSLRGDRREAVNEAEADAAALYEAIEEAKQAWQHAKLMYEYATDKDNIDALIHTIDACERKYIYLLELARKESISVLPDIK